MSESPGKATFTLLLALLTVVVAAAAATLLGGPEPVALGQESANYAGLNAGEALELQLLAHKESPAFEAGVDALGGPRAPLVLTHLLFALDGADQSRRFYVADTLKLRTESAERDELLSVYLMECLRDEGPKRGAARAALLDWTLRVQGQR